MEVYVPIFLDILICSVERLWVVYPGKIGYPMDDKIACVPLAELSGIRDMVAKGK